MTCALIWADGALIFNASPGHTSSSSPGRVLRYVPLQSALELAAACRSTTAALRQSRELRAGGFVTLPIQADTGGKPESASCCWLAVFTARPKARPTVR